ncbi:MAG: glycosyltransferase family 4 protein [Syntrophaceae bacterium]|nr:glycosyltransferase family 4 protein [Syntrophaceae bacterium]
MNTLMITESYFPSDIRVKREAFKLIENGYGVSVIALKKREQSFYEVINGIKVYRIPKIEVFKHGKQSHSNKLTKAKKFILLIKAVLGYGFEYFYFTFMSFILSFVVLIKNKFDVIHTHNPPDTLFIIPLFYKLFGKKFIYDHHDLSPDLFLEKYGSTLRAAYKFLLILEVISCKVADRVIATNESYKKIESDRCGVNPENIYVVRYGPDLKEMKKAEPIEEIRSKAKTILCYLGVVNSQDGVDHLLYVMRHIVYKHGIKDIILLVIGDGDYLGQIKEVAKHLEIQNNVLFTGYIYDRQLLNRYLSSSDVFVDAAPHSFLNDNSTFIKMMEYMIFQKPVVSFALKESMYSLQDAGIFIPNDDTEKMADAIVNIISDKQLQKQLGINAELRVQQLSWDKVSLPLIHTYESLQCK